MNTYAIKSSFRHAGFFSEMQESDTSNDPFLKTWLQKFGLHGYIIISL